MDHIPSATEIQSSIPQLSDVEFVASGGFKAVYKAQNQVGVEAIKVVFIPPPADKGIRDQIIARVEREVNVLGQCQTPFLVKLGNLENRILSISGHDYITYSEEFLPGQSVIDLINHTAPPSFENIVSLSRCLMQALQEIATLGHLHRDIKPHNIISTGNADRPFVVLDLGIAFKLQGTELTAPGAGPPGTTIYMAPELFRPDYKDVLDIRSDLYSAGATIFEFATGTHPLAKSGEDLYATMYRILHQQPPKLDTLRSDLPTWFCGMVDRCLKKTPALRFHSPQAFLDELDRQI